MKKSTLFITTICVLLVILSGCGDNSTHTSEKSNTENPTTVAVAVLNNYPPLIYKDQGQLSGMDYDILNAIAKHENLALEYKEMKFDGFFAALQARQADVAASGITITDERKEIVDFTDVYYESGLVLVTRNDSSIETFEDLKDKTIVATNGSTTHEMAKEVAAQYDAKSKALKETDTVYLDVENGYSDALIMNRPPLLYKMKVSGDNNKLKIVGENLTIDRYAYAVSKDKPELKEKLNSGLQKIKISGEYDEIVDKWLSE
ncbi:transporter substrate-binding domain-containing protein [Sporosarcina sp. FSL K6-1522]|uniref:transporter substrate-binding domain-containing protein n=1 Tax=Sporosarcina sp. FSL K6-1522 TaxID=2921554 RepID=UPI003159EB74